MIIKKINNSKVGNVKSSKNKINNKKIDKKKASSPYTEKKGKKDSKKVISKSKSNKKNLQTKVSKNKPEKSEKVKSSKKKDNLLNDINVKEPKIKKKPSKKLKINEIAKKVSSKIKNKVNKVFSENKKKRKRNSTKNSMDSCDKKRQSSESVLNKDNKDSKDRAKCNIKRVSRSPSLPKSVLTNVGCGTRNSTSNCVSNDTLSSVKDNKVNYSNTKLDKSKMKDDPSKKSKLSQNNVNDKKKVLKKDLDKKDFDKKKEKNTKKQSESLSKKQNGTETSKNLSKSKNKMNQKNTKNKLKKQNKKTSVNKKSKINHNVNRKHRVASLNALAKVRVLSENDNDQDKSGEHEESDHDVKNIIGKKEQKKQVKKEQKKQQVKKEQKKQQQVNNNKKEKDHKNYSKTSKAIVPIDNSKKQLAVKKRKLVDDCVEIIDTRTCKRMASLNASAILAASYSPLIKRSKSSESNKSINGAGSSVKMIREMQIKATVSHYEITPSCGTINGIQRSEVNSVILKEQKHETVETIKQMKMSSKIKERLIGIARLEQSEEAKRKRKNKRKINRHSDDDNEEEEDDDVVNQIGALGGGVSEFQATKVHVTKVTKINTSNKKNEKDKKSKGHKIESILERDSSVVRKYQVQTKSTSQSFCVQMQTTYNSSSSNDNLITASGTPALVPPIQQANPSGVQLQLPSTAAHIIPTPFITQAHSQIASSQPTYINYPGHPSILQIPHQAVASSAPHINPLSIVNLADPYSSHYSSAFSVPHFANHPHGPYAYYHPEFYQPTGSLIQSIHDPCLIHKPIPFHPANQPIRHIHRPQFNPGSLHTTSIIPTVQTFQNDATQLFQPTPSNLIRPPQTVLFNPPTATFTLVNSNLQIAQPNVNLSEQYPNNEIQLINTTNNNNGSILSQPTNNATEYSCKSVQCSPPTSQTINVSSTASKHSATNMNSNNLNKIPNVATVHPQVTKRQLNKSSDNSIRKKKSSLLLKPTNLQKSDITSQTVASQTSIDDHPPHQHTKKVKSALTPANLNRINNMVNTCSNHQTNAVVVLNQPTKTISIQVSLSPSPSPTTVPRLLNLKKSSKKKFSHGWNWEGDPFEKLIYLCNEDQPCLRKCYAAIRHNEGDIIRVRDCVLLRSGPRKTDLPFVAKISALWETPNEGEMMMSLLWYYRPEHTDLEKKPPIQIAGEVFASKHRDTNSVACIDDKCYVLTYNEFCRYQSNKLLKKSLQTSLAASIVPPLQEPYPRLDRLPSMRVFPELVFCCRKVYDFRQKRILKNPI